MSERHRLTTLAASLALLVGLLVVVNIVPVPSVVPDRAPAASRHNGTPSSTIPITTNPAVEAPYVSSTPSFIVLRYATGLWRVRITRATQFCRAPKRCAAARSDLEPGDRVSVMVPNSTATRVDVNFDAETVRIDAIDGDRLTVHNTRHDYEPNPPYTLVVQPDTIIVSSSSDGTPATNQPLDPQVGEVIYYTGWAASPSGAYTGQATPSAVDSTVYAARIFP